MDISEELKKRFCEDCCIPIDIYSEPIFASRIELYDRFYNTVERYNVFLNMLAERYTSYVMESTATVNILKSGNCSIHAISVADSNKIGKCEIVVTDETDYDEIQSVTLNLSEMYLGVGHTRTLIAIINPVKAYDNAIIWETSNPDIVDVDLGRVYGKTLGKCTITAYSNKDKTKYASCNVEVTAWKPITSITLQHHSTKICIGQQENLNATISPADATTSTLYWSSSNTNVATVNSSGTITGVSGGRCVITVSKHAPDAQVEEDQKVTDVCLVLVNDLIPVSHVLLNRTSVDMVIGSTYTLIASVYPINATNRSVTWNSSNTAIAAVDSKTGVITAIGIGRCTISVICNDESPLHLAECILNVVAPFDVRYIKVTPSIYPPIVTEDDELHADPEESNPTLLVGQSFEVTSTICIGYNVDPDIRWKSTSDSIATVKGSSAEPVLKSSTIHIDHYYSDYDNIKCKLIQYIQNSSKYKEFCNKSSTEWATNCVCMGSSIYTSELDGHTMIGVRLDKPLFTALLYYSPEIFSEKLKSGSNNSYYSTWEDFVSSIGETDNHHIIYSENLLNEVMCCCNGSKIQLYGRWLLSQFYLNKIKELLTDSVYEGLPSLVYFGYDEFVIDVTGLVDVIDLNSGSNNISKMTNRLTRLYYDIVQRVNGYFCPCTELTNTSSCNCNWSSSSPLPMTARLFTLYKLKTEYENDEEIVVFRDDIDGYVENIYYEGNQPLRFVDTDPCQLPLLMRSMSYQSLQDNDRKFIHRGLMASFTDDYKIHVPPISSIPDLPKILAEKESGDHFENQDSE